MGIIQYIGTKHLIFTHSNVEKTHYMKPIDGQKISYNDVVWNKEEFILEEDWINRLTELGVVDEELGITQSII